MIESLTRILTHFEGRIITSWIAARATLAHVDAEQLAA